MTAAADNAGGTAADAADDDAGVTAAGAVRSGRDGGPPGSDQPGPVVLLLSGPNLNLLGDREPEIYGTDTLEDHVATARRAAAPLGLTIEHLQANHEGALVEAIHAARGRCAAVVINAGSFTHYAWSIHDALAAFDGPVVELHLSNPNSREPWRTTSVVAPVANGTIAGFGGDGYRLAIDAVARLLGAGA